MLNVDPMTTFADGSLLLVSTRYSGEGGFICRLYRATSRPRREEDLDPISVQFEAATCRQAQQRAYDYAVQLYPDIAKRMKKPPYMIWSGPLAPPAPGRRSR